MSEEIDPDPLTAAVLVDQESRVSSALENADQADESPLLGHEVDSETSAVGEHPPVEKAVVERPVDAVKLVAEMAHDPTHRLPVPEMTGHENHPSLIAVHLIEHVSADDAEGPLEFSRTEDTRKQTELRANEDEVLERRPREPPRVRSLTEDSVHVGLGNGSVAPVEAPGDPAQESSEREPAPGGHQAHHAHEPPKKGVFQGSFEGLEEHVRRVGAPKGEGLNGTKAPVWEPARGPAATGLQSSRGLSRAEGTPRENTRRQGPWVVGGLLLARPIPPPSEHGAAAGVEIEKRGSRRRPTTAEVTIEVLGAEIEAVGRDISKGGLYALTGDPLHVRVVLREGTRETEVTGRIVRVDSPASETTGIAIVFDRPIP